MSVFKRGRRKACVEHSKNCMLCSPRVQLDPGDDPLKFTKSFIQMINDMSS